MQMRGYLANIEIIRIDWSSLKYILATTKNRLMLFFTGLFLEEFLVLVLGEQIGLLGLELVAQLDLEEPTVLHRRRVDQRRRVLDRLVLLEHESGDRRVQLGGRLHRLEGAAVKATLDLVVGLGQLGVDDVAERLLGVVADAHDAPTVLHLDPLVALRVVKRARESDEVTPTLQATPVLTEDDGAFQAQSGDFEHTHFVSQGG